MPVLQLARVIKRYKVGRDDQGSYKVYGEKAIMGVHDPVVKKLDFNQ